MRVFIAGGTGVLGRRVIPRLVAKGHRVTALARSRANETLLRELGAEPRTSDLFDAASVREGSSGVEAILHLATAIPTKPRTVLGDWALNDRIRREGTKHLVAAALHHRARFYLQQSVVFVYGDRSGEWVDESAPLASNPAAILRSAHDMEGIVREAHRIEGLPAATLRFGSFYGPDASHTQMLFEMARRDQAVVIGGGGSYTNPIHVDDAADATVLAVENHDHIAGEVLNLCDDEPATFRQIVELIVEELETRRPRNVPKWLANFLLGSHVARSLTASVRVRNEKAKERIGFRPAFPTYREGYRDALEKWLRSGNLTKPIG